MFLVERKRTGIFYIKVVFRAGAAHEAPSRAGISHLLEHLLFQTEGDELQREIEALGGNSNAFTGLENTTYFMKVPANEFARAIRAMKRIVTELSCDDKTLEDEKRIVIQERASTMDPKEDLYAIMLENTPYAKSIIGTRDTINAITLTDLKRYHRERYLNGGCYIAAFCPSGRVDEVTDVLQSEFAGFYVPSRDPLIDFLKDRKNMTVVASYIFNPAMASSRRTNDSKKKEKTKSDTRRRMDPKPEDRSLSICTLLYASRTRRDLRDIILDQFLCFVAFAGGLGSVLNAHMREQKHLTYGLSGGHNSYTGANILTIEVSSEADILFVVGVLLDKIRTVCSDGLVPTDSAFKRFQSSFRNSLKVSSAAHPTFVPDMVLNEAMNCQVTAGCHTLTGSQSPKQKRKKTKTKTKNDEHDEKERATHVIDEAEAIERVLNIVDTIERKELNTLATAVFTSSCVVSISGNNTLRTDSQFKSDLESQMAPRAEANDLRLNMVFPDELSE